MSRSICNVHRLRSIPPVHARHRLSDVHKPWPMRQTMTNVSWMMPLAIGWSRFLKKYAVFDAAYSWLILRCPIHVHTLRMMRVGLEWCFLLLHNISCMIGASICWCCPMLDDANDDYPIHTYHNRGVKAFVDVAFHWSIILAECTYAILDALRPWVMQPIFWRHRLAYMHGVINIT